MNTKGMLLSIVAALPVLAASLPDEFEIHAVDKQTVRNGYERVLLHDYDSRELIHPYFIESVNAVLNASGDTAVTLPVPGEGIGDSSIGFHLELLERNGRPVYIMDGLQGRVLRVLIDAGVPVLALGRVRNAHRGITRTYGDVVYAYRTPDYTQSSKKDPGEYYYTFKTVRGFRLDCRELYAPPTQERNELDLLAMSEDDPVVRLQYQVQALEERRAGSPLKNPPYNVFQYYCVVTTPGRSLDDIKRIINDGLADVGFEYKLPEFRTLTASMLE